MVVEGQEVAPSSQKFSSVVEMALHQQPLQCQNQSNLPNLNLWLIPALSLQCLLVLRHLDLAQVFRLWQAPPFLLLVYVQLHHVELSFET